jgi:hypothetical protein
MNLKQKLASGFWKSISHGYSVLEIRCSLEKYFITGKEGRALKELYTLE